MSLSEVERVEIPNSHWELYASDSKRDLILKKIALAIIAILNFAALGIALYYIVSYCPIPSQAILVPPFIVGALGALAYLKFPTCGINSTNYSGYLNPANMLGKILAYVFFGPLTYAVDKMDWTPYHDPIYANTVSNDLDKKRFNEIADKYGAHFDNLVKYGFIHDTQSVELLELYKNYKPHMLKLDFLKKAGLESHSDTIECTNVISKLDSQWKNLKSRFKYPLPRPKMDLDFSKTTTSLKLKARQYCCIGNPFSFLTAS